jgi:sortase A
MLLGAVCLGVWGYASAESWIYQRYETYVLDTDIAGKQPTVREFALQTIGWSEPAAAETERQAYADLAAPSAPSISLPADGLIGRIEVPRAKVSATLREGVDGVTLRRSAGHVPGTALPGEAGNVAVAAHRDGLFRGLKDIRSNDIVRVTSRSGTMYQYRVHATEIVEPTDVEVLEPRRKHELTLITCYPFYYVGKAPKRFIVRAEQLVQAAAAPPTAIVKSPAPKPVVKRSAAKRSAARKLQALKLRRQRGSL